MFYSNSLSSMYSIPKTPVKTYPGIQKVGQIEVKDYRRSSDPQIISQLLYFTFNVNVDPSVASSAFEKYFIKAALKSYRVVKQQPVVIEAFFDCASDCHRIVKQTEPHYEIVVGKRIRAKVELPLPMEPQLKVYTLNGLPLDYPVFARELVRTANIIRIVQLMKQNPKGFDKSIVLGSDCIVDILPGSKEGGYDGTMCIILKNFKGLVDTNGFNRMIEVYGSFDMHPEQYCQVRK